jgi:hypothetical protein
MMTFAGIAAIAAALSLDLNRTILLVGMMLVVAGGVKIIIVGLWHSVAAFGAPASADVTSHSVPGKERLR